MVTPSTDDYILDVGNVVTELDSKGITADEIGVISGTEYKSLKVGQNIFVVTITTLDGASKKYTLTANR